MQTIHWYVYYWLIATGTFIQGVHAQVQYQHPIPFEPEQYICYRTETPLQIDGKLEEIEWSKAPWTKDFVDIEGILKPLPPHRTRAKMLWDDEYFYFAAMLEEPHLWATLRQRDTVIFYDDDFEIFIDPDGDGHNYYEFEMNAHNTVWDLLMLWPYHLGRGPNHVFNWNNPGLRTAVSIKGSLNDPTDRDEYWFVEIAFPWSALRELAPGRKMPKEGDQWRVNFSRVDWHMEVIDGRYVKVKDVKTGKHRPPENWVWSPTGRIDMHRPETWGFVQFSGRSSGSTPEAFTVNPDENIKWALWQLFYQQRAFHKEHGRYSSNTARFTLPKIDGGDFNPKLFAGSHTFAITAPATTGGTWVIDHTGKIWKE